MILSGEVFPRYGYPNDILTRLGRLGARVIDVPVRPVYGPEWRSGIRIPGVVLPLLGLLARGMWSQALCSLQRRLPGSRLPVPEPPP
jgi:hypothetical protein